MSVKVQNEIDLETAKQIINEGSAKNIGEPGNCGGMPLKFAFAALTLGSNSVSFDLFLNGLIILLLFNEFRFG